MNGKSYHSRYSPLPAESIPSDPVKISQAISSVRFRSLNQVQFENFRDIHPP